MKTGGSRLSNVVSDLCFGGKEQRHTGRDSSCERKALQMIESALHAAAQVDVYVCAVLPQASMECVCLRRWASGSAVVLLHTLALSWTGAVEHAAKIDGRHRAAVTLQENTTHWFHCQSDGWDPHAPPLLTWYLNGEQQRAPPPYRGRLVMKESSRENPEVNPNSTFSLRARKWDRELVCVASNPRTGESHNATVTLNVQFQPEILRLNAHYSETSDPGLSLVLFALVRSNPPATITFMDQSGQPVANTSDFLILDSRRNPWLTNHTLKVTLGNLSGNISMNVSNSVGTVQSNLTLAEFLQSRVEVPMLGIVTGGAMAFMALLILSLIVLCLMQKNKTKTFDEPVEILMTKKSESANLKIEKPCKTYIPRENMSLPSNMQLNDLNTLRKAREVAQQNSVGEKKEEEEEDLSLAYAARGFARYPMVGYIYKVNSTSSEEIWL
ncbi:transmembrane protein 25 [Anoplopoma fimbria]|uniref:transmembrane protein 25 n=1 Tax=Anoplopoma fimbria TaxID=229290 RepID=UPI0023EBE7EA|nr:transmembrane protein 25 [Anoplopoma fimbria]